MLTLQAFDGDSFNTCCDQNIYYRIHLHVSDLEPYRRTVSYPVPGHLITKPILDLSISSIREGRRKPRRCIERKTLQGLLSCEQGVFLAVVIVFPQGAEVRKKQETWLRDQVFSLTLERSQRVSILHLCWFVYTVLS
jgi:hypothetical protein